MHKSLPLEKKNLVNSKSNLVSNYVIVLIYFLQTFNILFN